VLPELLVLMEVVSTFQLVLRLSNPIASAVPSCRSVNLRGLMGRSKSETTSPRRQFIGELAAGAAALAAAACAPAAAASSAAQAPTPAVPSSGAAAVPPPVPAVPTKWDASWMDRITAKHKAVFDSPEIGDGTALYQAFSYLGSIKDVFGMTDSDASVVCVFRHRGVPVLFSDAMWAKYNIGAESSTTDEKTRKPVTRNIYYQDVDAQGNPKDDKPSATIKSLSARGVIFVGCDLATRGLSSRIAQHMKLDQKTVYADLKANMVPGATLMPTGVFATLMAQDAGCAFMKST
jgi:hypothetical protein